MKIVAIQTEPRSGHLLAGALLGSQFALAIACANGRGVIVLLLTHGRTIRGSLIGFRVYPDEHGELQGRLDVFPDGEDYPVAVNTAELVGVLAESVERENCPLKLVDDGRE